LTRVRALPVMYACQGCEAHGQAARATAERLERAGRVEAAWIGTPGLELKAARYPIIALDACVDSCALRWLERRGVRVDQHHVLSLT